jgi:hypothetical protein
MAVHSGHRGTKVHRARLWLCRPTMVVTMSMPNQTWGTIHPSAYRHSAEPMSRVAATLRPSGAVRYRCPVTGCFVLITDPPTLARIAEHDIRTRCMECGEMHFLTQEAPALARGGIVAGPAKP